MTHVSMRETLACLVGATSGMYAQQPQWCCATHAACMRFLRRLLPRRGLQGPTVYAALKHAMIRPCFCGFRCRKLGWLMTMTRLYA
jgi:hypothetical protein